MNLEVLSHIIDNEPERIEELAAEESRDPGASVGIAKLVLSKKGNLSNLTEKQVFLFNKCVLPLIDNVQCEGVMGYDDEGQDTCVHGGIVDDESLLLSYMEDDFKCQNCRYDEEKMAGE